MLFQTTLRLDPHDTLCMVDRVNADGVAHFLTQIPGGNLFEDGLEFVWEPDVKAPQLRITLKPDGTWHAHTIVTVGEED